MNDQMRQQIMEILYNAAATLRMANDKREAMPLKERAVARAADAIAAYAPETIAFDETDVQDVLTDLLTDLRHWSHAEHVDFDRSVRLSATHFEAEKEGDE